MVYNPNFHKQNDDNDLISNPLNYEKLLILEMKDNINLALEMYLIRKGSGKNEELAKATLLSRIFVLYSNLEPAIKRKGLDKSDEAELIKNKYFVSGGNVSLTHFYIMISFLFGFLDDIQLTRIDLKKNINTINAEERNQLIFGK